MSLYTRIGVNFWNWSRFRELKTNEGKLLLLALYTSSSSKLLCPGLYKGSIATMSEDSGMPPEDVRKGLDDLLEVDLVEYDVKQRLLRLTEFPDTGESPSNGKVIRAWFRGYNSSPACPVRDAHVATLRKLIDDWCREQSKKLSADHENAWADTFGRISVVPRKRVVRRAVQTDLFEPTPDPDPSPDTLSQASPAVDNPCSGGSDLTKAESNDSAVPETVSDTVTKGTRSGSGERQRSGSSFSGADPDPATGLPGDHDREAPALPRTVTRPVLTLVPPPTDLAAAQDILDALAREAGGTFKSRVREGMQDALCRAISTIAREDRGPPELALVGQQLARAPNLVHGELGDPTSKLCAWLATTGAYMRALDAARRHEQQASDRSAMLAESMKHLGMT